MLLLLFFVGVASKTQFRAVLYPHDLTSMPVLYDAVHCSRADTLTKRNLWDCSSVVDAVPDRCDPNTEAAGVTCEAMPTDTGVSSAGC